MSHKPKILIVDDEPRNVKLLSAMLPSEKYASIPAYDGDEALEKVVDEAPDLILLDIMLPEMDGFEVCENLKKSKVTEAVPVIMLTSKGTEEDICEGLELGASDYLTKPFSPRTLLTRIEDVLGRHSTDPKE